MGHTIEAHSGRRPLEIFRAQAALFEQEQRAFITGFGSGLNLSEFDGILLHRLAVASPAYPVTTSRLSAYMLAEFYDGRVDPRFARRQTLADISYLNRKKLPGAEVRIHNMSAPRQEGQYFIGGADNWLFPEQAEAMNLIAAGFSHDEIIIGGIRRSVSTLKHLLRGIYSWLGVRNELSAGLFLAQHGQVDLDLLTQRVNIDRFSSLQPGQIEILESLISAGGRTNSEIASELGITVPVAEHRFEGIYNALGVNGIVNRVGVGIAYWIFKGQPKLEKPRSVTQF